MNKMTTCLWFDDQAEEAEHRGIEKSLRGELVAIRISDNATHVVIKKKS